MTHDRTITEVEEMETARDCNQDACRPKVTYQIELDREERDSILEALEAYRIDLVNFGRSPEAFDRLIARLA